MLSLTTTEESTHLEKQLLKFSEYQDKMLYGKHGYYTSGDVGFTEHFETNATAGIALAMLLCEHIHLLYQQEITEGIRNPDIPFPFIAIELSGGNGQLAYQTLSFIKKLAKKTEGLYPMIWRDIQYKTYEISPALFKKQRDLCAVFETKFIPINDSAFKIREERGVSFCFSNELWDNLTVDLLKVSKAGEIEVINVAVCLPIIPERFLAQIERAYTKIRPPDGFNINPELSSDLDIPEGFIALNKAAISAIENNLSKENWPKFLKKITWIKRGLSISNFRELNNLLTTHSACIDLDREVEIQFPSQGLALIAAIKACNPRAQAHWDYGFVHKGGARDPIRSFGDRGPHTFDMNIFGVDITTSVDFHTIAKALSNQEDKEKPYLENTLIHFQAMSFVMVREGLLSRAETWQEMISGEALKGDIGRYLSRSSEFLVLYVSHHFKLPDTTAALTAASDADQYPESPMLNLSCGLPFNRVYKEEAGRFGYSSLTPRADLEHMNAYLTTDHGMRTIIMPLLSSRTSAGLVADSTTFFAARRSSLQRERDPALTRK